MTNVRLFNFIISLAFLGLSMGAQAQITWTGTVNYTTTQTITQTINVAGATTVNVSSGVTLTVSGVISGSAALTVQGGGKLILTAANTYNGAITIAGSGSILQIGDGTSGSLANTSGVLINDSTAILRFEPGANMTFDKVISGSGKVECKVKASTALSFTANNTYSGTTTIENGGGGYVQLGNNTPAGGVAGDIINNSRLAFARTTDYVFPKVISGTGSVYKFMPAKVTLTGANIYKGFTEINDGTLQIGDGTSGSIDSTSNVQLDFATCILRFEPGADMKFSKVISGSGKVEFKGADANNKMLIFTADNNYTGGTKIEQGRLVLGHGGAAGSVAGNIENYGLLDFYRSNDYIYTGVISGTGSVLKTGGGKVILTGINTYTGTTSLNGDAGNILQIGDGTSGSIANTSSVYIASGGTLSFEPGGTMTFSKVISGGGNVEYKGGGYLYLTADNNYSGTTTIESSALYLGNGGTTGSVIGDIIINKDALLNFNRSNDYTYSGVISGDGNVRKSGIGKLILNGVNTFTGTTFIPAGTLALGAGGSIENSYIVYLYYNNTTFDISAGSKKIKGLRADSDSPNAVVLLDTSTLTIGTAGQTDGNGYFYGIFSGTGNVIKQGTGEFHITNGGTAIANTATGMFTLKEGLLEIDGRKWAGNFTQNAGTVLQGDDTIAIGGNATLNGGTIAMNLTNGNPQKLSVGGAVSTS